MTGITKRMAKQAQNGSILGENSLLSWMTDEVTASKLLVAHYTTFFQEFNTFHRFQFSTPVISRISKHN